MNTQPAIVLLAVIAGCVMWVASHYRYKQRELQHRERMAAIDKGAALPAMEDLAAPGNSLNPRILLLSGLIWLFAGIGLFVFLGAFAATSHRETPAWERVNEANRAKERGATDEQVKAIMEDRQDRGMPAGVALIGLIPFGVGMAYLITYRVEKRAELVLAQR